MSGTCAIYVPERQLDIEEKTWVQTSAEDCKKYVLFRFILGANYLFENGGAPSIPCILPVT